MAEEIFGVFSLTLRVREKTPKISSAIGFVPSSNCAKSDGQAAKALFVSLLRLKPQPI